MEKRNWFKDHADTLAILGTFAICFWTLNEKIDHLEDKFNTRLTVIERDVTIIKTVLVMKDILPKDLAKHEDKK